MAFTILYTIKDEKNEGGRSTMEVNLPSATAFADVVLFAKEMAALINATITGQILRIGVAFIVDLPDGLRTAPLANSDVEEGAQFQFLTSGSNYTRFRIPTFDESLIVAGTKSVDTADASVAALVTAMESGINLTGVGGSGTIQPSDKRDEDIVSLSYAKEMFLSTPG